MATLDPWRRFLNAPQVIEFPCMKLIAGDFEPEVVIGSGEVRIPDLHHFEFTLEGIPSDFGHAMRSLRAIENAPYEGLARLRLLGTDAHGMEWMLGWTVPQVSPGDNAWRFVGELDVLALRCNGAAPEQGTELLFVIPPSAPMHSLLIRAMEPLPHLSGSLRREKEIRVLGSRLRFSYEIADRTLSVTSTPSQDLPLTFSEHWLSEPFRILFGQLMTPRLVARNFGNGEADIFIPTISPYVSGASWAALWSNRGVSGPEFWSLYGKLLTFFATQRKNEGLDIEPHKLTKLYEEVIQASSGSRWVWAMTFASSIEALTQMISPPRQRPDADQLAMKELINHIRAWRGEARLKDAAIQAIHRSGQTTTIYNLRQFLADEIITRRQFDAWSALRNSVMHGSLVSPYSSQEEDDRLIALAEMMHALARELLSRSLPNDNAVVDQ